jgi:uncharacterized RDD family membrane protein YckC
MTEQPPVSYASWGDRAVAYLWDVLYMWPTWIALTVSTVVLVTGIVANERDGDNGAALIAVGFAAFFAATIWAVVRMVRNLMIRQGRTGQSWGKAKAGIWVVKTTGGVPGVGSCVGRYFLHGLINEVFYIDFLWPLWDERKQTLTDKILDTVVVRPSQ